MHNMQCSVRRGARQGFSSDLSVS